MWPPTTRSLALLSIKLARLNKTRSSYVVPLGCLLVIPTFIRKFYIVCYSGFTKLGA